MVAKGMLKPVSVSTFPLMRVAFESRGSAQQISQINMGLFIWQACRLMD
jgi:hypothetical protein